MIYSSYCNLATMRFHDLELRRGGLLIYKCPKKELKNTKLNQKLFQTESFQSQNAKV